MVNRTPACRSERDKDESSQTEGDQISGIYLLPEEWRMEAETPYQIGEETRIQTETAVKAELGSIDGIPDEKDK